MPYSRSHRRIGPCVVWLLFRSMWYTKRPFSVFVDKAAVKRRSARSSKHNHEFRLLAVNSVLDHPWRYFLRCGGPAKRAVLRPVGA